MWLLCYAVRDEKALCFHTPFYAKHVVEAIRQFTHLVNAGSNTVSVYPEDYALYLVSHFDDETGVSKFTASGAPELVSRALDVIKPQNGGLVRESPKA